jgi:hypothetical protein
MTAAVAPGTIFAGYRVESLVGRGGMGVVYRATDLALERPVALKLIAPEAVENVRFRRRFLTEPRLAASLDHASVVPIYEAGERDGQLFLAMRYVDGSDLGTILERDGKLTAERALAILTQVAGALDAAHRRGLVHRDVKPGNVLVDTDGHAYLTDFGVSEQLTDVSPDAGRVAGTLDYLSPEQIRGERVDGRSDCYALACVFYECLAGARPFRRDTEAETLWAHLYDEPPPLHAYPALDPVLAKGLSKEREGRYASCHELIDAASGALGLGGRPRRALRFRLAVLLFALSVAVLGATTVLTLRERDGNEPRTSAGPVLDLATNSVAAIEASTREPVFARPLPGRATDVVTAGDTVWITTVDSAALVGVNARTRTIVRTVPLDIHADAVALGEGSVWVADGRRGVLARITPGYERVTKRIEYPPAPRAPSQSAPHASLAAAHGAVWVTNGSKRLIRVDAETGRATLIPTDRALDGVAAGAGALWAISSTSARVLRIDPGAGAVTDTIRIVAPGAEDAPFPVSIAASAGAVWVLSANTASVTEIDPRTVRPVNSVPIGVDRAPADIAAADSTAWVANGDASLSRLEAGDKRANWIWIGESLERVAADGDTVWVTTTAVDQKFP